MERGIQKKLSELTGISQGHLAHLLNGNRRASYETGEKLAMITGTPIALWINGSAKRRQQATESWFNNYRGANETLR